MINIEPIEAFSDNYIWLITTNEGSIVIDPGESQNLLKILKENNLNLKAILITHHHFDHTGGINEILLEKSIDVYGQRCGGGERPREPRCSSPSNLGLGFSWGLWFSYGLRLSWC